MGKDEGTVFLIENEEQVSGVSNIGDDKLSFKTRGCGLGSRRGCFWGVGVIVVVVLLFWAFVLPRAPEDLKLITLGTDLEGQLEPVKNDGVKTTKTTKNIPPSPPPVTTSRPTVHSRKAVLKEVMEAIGEDLKSNMDQSYDPCEHFYMFSCGGWIKKHQPDEGEEARTVFKERDKANTIAIRDILESLESSSGAVRQARDFYISCLIKDTIDNPVNLATEPPATNDDGLDSFESEDDLSNYMDVVEATTEISSAADDYNDPIRGVRRTQEDFKLLLNSSDEAGNVKVNEAVSIACATTTLLNFQPALARLFVKKLYLSKEAEVRALFEEVGAVYKSLISKTPWMDEKTKNYINKRLDEVTLISGYTQNVMNVEDQDLKYNMLTIRNDSYTSNLIQLEPLQVLNLFRPFDEQDDAILLVNAFYAGGEIFIAAGLTQKPFFDMSYPEIINYAKFATTIGHELSHGLNAIISNEDIDYQWTTRPIPISNRSLQNFESRKNCIQEQYGKFHVDLEEDKQLPLNGSTTFEENFADIAGLQVAFKAYMQKHKKFFEVIPGVEEMSQEQLFFIAAAQTECRSFPNKLAKERVLTNQIGEDPHSPNFARVLGEMLNFDEFAKAFKCSTGSRYNPPHKCHVFT